MSERLTGLLFDPYFYAEQSGATGDFDELRRHFDKAGRQLGLSPGPLFDARWYASSYGDVAQSGVLPFDHFVKWGAREGRNPNPIFDAEWYRTQPDVGVRRISSSVTHYIQVGAKERLQPHPLFWPQWYKETQVSGECADPLAHYLTEGWRAGLAPCPLFDPVFYSERHMGDARGSCDPLQHFLDTARDAPALSPHILFDGQSYLRGLNQRGIACDGPALAHYLNAADFSVLPDPHPLFDTQYYLGQRDCDGRVPPLVAYLANNTDADPNPFFISRYYKESAPDVAASGFDALTHYIRAGDREGRRFHPLIDPDALAPDPYGQSTRLEEYLLRGSRSGVRLRVPEAADTLTRAPSPLRRVMEVPRDAALNSKTERAGVVGIFAHIFHVECAEEMILLANNAPLGRTRLFISTTSADRAREIERIAKAASIHLCEIRVFENRGRDIAPFIVGYADRLREVEFGLHIHSKKSQHYSGGFDRWREYLLDQTLGSTDLVGNILGVLSHPGIGAYCPDHFDAVRPLLQWGGNLNCARALMSMMGEDVDRDTPLEFPSGSMFWFRADALKPLLDCNLRFEHFDAEAGQVDGTLAHAIERVFLAVVAAAGYSYVAGTATETGGVRTSPVDLTAYANRLHPMYRDAGAAAAFLPHTAGYLGIASDIDRPRINLLVPTVDRGRAYAGVSTALEFYESLRHSLGRDFDARVIATDVAPAANFASLDGYCATPLDAADCAHVDTIVDGTDRRQRPMNLRPRDVFVATAWWTAHQARMLRDRQIDLFGTAPHRFVYLIQDFENGFEPWSTAWALTDATYRDPDQTIPVFNTPLLFDYFRTEGYFGEGHILHPAINRDFAAAIEPGWNKEKIVLLYARPHAARNCLEFLDMVVSEAVAQDPARWNGWRFLAIGEDFGPGHLAQGSHIEIVGRLSIESYAKLASRASLAMSLMVSPHPSYPPLEMAAAGVRVLTNGFGARDCSELHENIESFDVFDAVAVAAQFGHLAAGLAVDANAGWSAQAKVDWFFDGRTNLDEVTEGTARDIRADLGIGPELLTSPELRLLPTG